jgi:hypothetical protein
MAKASQTSSSSSKISKGKKKRPGVHSKCKTSVSKNAKNYKKKSVGQGG